MPSEVDPQIMWETTKCAIRGFCISFSSTLAKAEFILHRTRQKYYFKSERPSHLLALRLKECESKAYISAIKSSDDQVTTNPVAINEIFKGFYTNLYKAETDFSYQHFFISFHTQHHNITSTQNKQNKTTDTYSIF